MTLRIDRDSPDTPEKLKSASIEDLTEFLLKPTQDDFEITDPTPVGYLDEAEESGSPHVIDLRPLRSEIHQLERDLIDRGIFHTPARLLRSHRLKKRLAELRKADIIPVTYQPIYLAEHESPAYETINGAQLSEQETVRLDLTILRECLAYEGTSGELIPIKETSVTHYNSDETYRDENGKIIHKTLLEDLSYDEIKKAHNPELLSVLRYFAELPELSEQ